MFTILQALRQPRQLCHFGLSRVPEQVLQRLWVRLRNWCVPCLSEILGQQHPLHQARASQAVDFLDRTTRRGEITAFQRSSENGVNRPIPPLAPKQWSIDARGQDRWIPWQVGGLDCLLHLIQCVPGIVCQTGFEGPLQTVGPSAAYAPAEAVGTAGIEPQYEANGFGHHLPPMS